MRLLVASDASLPRLDAIALDWRVLGFAAGLTLVTLLLFALLPAWRAARVDLVDSLKDGSQNTSSGERKQRLRGVLVVAEVAVALVLLTGAGLMLRTLWNLQRIDLGFDAERVLTMRLALPASQYDTPEKVNDFYGRLVTQVRGLSGVERAGLLRLLPLAAPIGDWGLTIEGFQPPPGVSTPGDWQVATAGGPEALGERLLAIVGNVRHNGVTSEVKPKFYRAHAQFHLSSGNPMRNMTLVVKTAGDPSLLIPAVRAEIRRLDHSLRIAAVRTMEDVVATSIATPRLTSSLLASFAGPALLLAAVGIYGVLAYVVSERRQEIGVRMAIGAGPGRVVKLILRQGVVYALIGVGVGLAASVAATRVLGALLHDVEALDPATFSIAPLMLLVVAILASLLPAWRATRVDPLRAMKAG